MSWFNGLILILCFTLSACASTQSAGNNGGIERLAKSDVDEVIEIHQHAVMADLQQLMVKLYKRNPGLRHDRELRSIEDSVKLAFAQPVAYNYPHWPVVKKPTDIVFMALDENFQGDRIQAFILGLRKMLMAAYDNHHEFYYFTSIDQQKLYNSARNIEIAAWLLAEKRDKRGKLLILSDSLEHEQRNLSYQRLIGEMIATQDNLAKVISQKSGRLIKSVVINAASMVFLPI